MEHNNNNSSLSALVELFNVVSQCDGATTLQEFRAAFAELLTDIEQALTSAK